MTITQIALLLFLLFALSRVVLRYKSAEVSVSGLIFWSMIFGFAIISVGFPDLTTEFAQKIGIGRGVDAALYISVALLFYLVFRLYVFIQDLRREITELVSKLALKEHEKTGKKTTKN